DTSTLRDGAVTGPFNDTKIFGRDPPGSFAPDTVNLVSSDPMVRSSIPVTDRPAPLLSTETSANPSCPEAIWNGNSACLRENCPLIKDLAARSEMRPLSTTKP